MSGTHTNSLKYKLDGKCTNNQAEQLAILRSLRYIQNLQTTEKTATVYTDSQMTLDFLKSSKIHTSLIENIRRKSMELEQATWKLSFCWVKAHARIQGNELADKLAKHAAGDLDISVSYNMIPKSVVKRELESISVDKWQMTGT
jgi:ribonuclease HI